MPILTNCNCILIIKPSKGTFRAKLPPVYHTRWRFHIVSFNVERQVGKLLASIFIVVGSTRPGIEPEPTVSIADAPPTRTLSSMEMVIFLGFSALLGF